MCPHCLIFFNWPGSSPLTALPSYLEKKVIRMEVIEKIIIICLDPPYFFVQICFELPTALDHPPSCHNLPFEKKCNLDEQTDGQIDRQTDEQPDYIMPPAAGSPRHKNWRSPNFSWPYVFTWTGPCCHFSNTVVVTAKYWK